LKLVYTLIFLIIANVSLFAQDTLSNYLVSQRKAFNTTVKQKGILLNYNQLRSLYKDENLKKSEKLLFKSRYFLPAGAAMTVGGIYLGYDAIKGTRKDIEINGINYTYYIRPIEQLLAGIAVLATGVSFIEYSNEFKRRSADLFNQSLKAKEKKKEFELGFGVTPERKFGLYAKF
jgi:hypothetical protein